MQAVSDCLVASQDAGKVLSEQAELAPLINSAVAQYEASGIYRRESMPYSCSLCMHAPCLTHVNRFLGLLRPNCIVLCVLSRFINAHRPYASHLSKEYFPLTSFTPCLEHQFRVLLQQDFQLTIRGSCHDCLQDFHFFFPVRTSDFQTLPDASTDALPSLLPTQQRTYHTDTDSRIFCDCHVAVMLQDCLLGRASQQQQTSCRP